MKEHIEQKIKFISKEIERERNSIKSLDMHKNCVEKRIVELENDMKIYTDRLVAEVIKEDKPFANPPPFAPIKPVNTLPDNFVPNSLKQTK